MSQKIGVEHLARSAVIYVRQSTMTQVLGNLESQKRQYALAGFDPEEEAGTISVDATAHQLGICVSSVHRLIARAFSPRRSLCPRPRGRCRSPPSTPRR